MRPECLWKQILRYPWHTVFDSLEAGVQSGVVTLRGSVNQPYRRTDIENRVASIEGLKGLVSEIRVQGASSFDEAVRRELVRAARARDPSDEGMAINESVEMSREGDHAHCRPSASSTSRIARTSSRPSGS